MNLPENIPQLDPDASTSPGDELPMTPAAATPTPNFVPTLPVDSYAAAESNPLPEAAAPPATEPAPQPPVIRLQFSGLSDIGCVRTNNEDSFGYSEPHGIFVVCDGMGGMASGEIASATAVSTLVETFIGTASSAAPVSTRLLQAIESANRAVWQFGQSPEHKGMGTTLVTAALDGDKLVIGNVGDSRAYMVDGNQCMQVTIDHSYVNELIRNGTLTPENAGNANLNGMASVITRAIGASAAIQPEFFSIQMRPGMQCLLATDGLTRYLLQEEIATILINYPFASACATLIQLAKQRGGVDNITCLLLQAT